MATVLPIAQFATANESVSAGAGSFSVPVTLTGSPTFSGDGSPAPSTYVSGLGSSGGLVFRAAQLASDAAGNLYATNDNASVNKITPGGVVSTFASGLGYPQ